jgi:hypothetical protein
MGDFKPAVHRYVFLPYMQIDTTVLKGLPFYNFRTGCIGDIP